MKQTNVKTSFWNDTNGQVSAELIIVIAALLAVAAVMISQLNKTATAGAGALTSKAQNVTGQLDSFNN